MKNVVKIFGIPMSSLGGVHLISGIAQYFLCGLLLAIYVYSNWHIEGLACVIAHTQPDKSYKPQQFI